MKKIAAALFCAVFLNANSLIAQTDAQSFPNTWNPSAQANALPSITWLKNYSDAVALSLSTSKPIAILFTGTGWCPACMQLERNVLTKVEFARSVGQSFVFLKAEFPDYSDSSVTASPYKPLLDRYGVKEFPTFVVIKANGQLLYTVNYRAGKPETYAQEMLQKLNQNSNDGQFH